MSTISKRQCILTFAMMIISGLLGGILSSAIPSAQANRPQQTNSSSPASVQKWDYRFIRNDPGTAERDLQALGNQGFEVAGFAATEDGGARPIVNVLLRRARP
jgi:hypothetical protein